MQASQFLRRNRLTRWLFQNTLVTGDNVRLAVQRPIMHRMLPARFERALDAGAGSGEYTRSLLIPRAGRVLTVELERRFVERFAGRLTSAERLQCLPTVGTLAHIPARDGTFDAVLCSEVIEHCEDDGAVVAELARVMSKGGVLVVSVPVPPAPYPDPAHVREGYTEQELKALLERHGFEVTDRAYCLFAISRTLMKWRIHYRTRVPLPLMGLVHLERVLWPRAGAESKPFDLVVRAVRR